MQSGGAALTSSSSALNRSKILAANSDFILNGLAVPRVILWKTPVNQKRNEQKNRPSRVSRLFPSDDTPRDGSEPHVCLQCDRASLVGV